MKLGTKKKAISAAAVAFIILGTIIGILAVFYVIGQTQASFCCNVRSIQITSMTFNATTATLNFTVNNPFPSPTTVSSVHVNQMPCTENFAPLKANALTSESCVVSGLTFTKGETVNYATSFANGQSITGAVYAQ